MVSLKKRYFYIKKYKYIYNIKQSAGYQTITHNAFFSTRNDKKLYEKHPDSLREKELFSTRNKSKSHIM